MTQSHYDFIIVGARCAGAATARLLALAGARVLLVERSQLGADTLSTSYLMRGAVLQLQRWRLLPQLLAAGTPPLRSTYVHYARHAVTVDLRPTPGFDALYAPRRTVLDPLLAAAASAAGAELRFGVRVEGLLRRDDGRVCGVELAHGYSHREQFTADVVIGADGLHSSVARWVNAKSYRTGRYGAPTIYGYFEGLPLDGYHWYYANGAAAGAAPTNDGLCTLFVAAPEASLDIRADRQASLLRIANRVSADLGAAIRDARRVGPLRAFPGQPGYYRTPFGAGWALVGDAGYYRDPCTAHGISDALRDAELLARALLRADESALLAYQTTRDAATQRLFEASDAIASGAWDEARVEQLLREANKGMHDSVRVVEAFAQATEAPAVSITDALHTRSYGTPDSRFEMRTDSRSGA